VRDFTSAVPFTSSRCGSNVAERSPWRSFRGSSAHPQLRPMVGFLTTTPLPLMQGHPACEPERSRAGSQMILRRVARPFFKSVVGVHNLQNAVTSTASRSSRVGRKRPGASKGGSTWLAVAANLIGPSKKSRLRTGSMPAMACFRHLKFRHLRNRSEKSQR
jgi:hypothetical protein